MSKKKLRESRKAVNGILVQAGTLVTMFAPQASGEYRAIVGVIGSLLTAAAVYFSTNERPGKAT